MKIKCRGCGSKEAFKIKRDPYDVLTSSPIIQSVDYCLSCYNERVIATIKSSIKMAQVMR